MSAGPRKGLNGVSGRCEKCRRPSKQGPLCQKCIEEKSRKTKKKAAKLKAANKCTKCVRDVDVVNEAYGYAISKSMEHLICPLCFFKTVASHNLKRISRAKDIRALYESQGRRCCYTGEHLVLGATASLDHKVPRSKGGDDTIENLQWCHHTVNMAKHSLTHEEFLDLCRRVLKGAGDGT